MPQGKSKYKGYVTVTVTDARTGKVKMHEIRNLVTDVGEQWVADRMLSLDAPTRGANTGAQNMSWIELGLSSQAAAATDTDLDLTYTPKTETRHKYTTQNRTGATWNIIVNWATGDANTLGIKEAGIFSTADSGGLLLARTVFSAINKTSSDTLKIQWQINVADDGA